MEIIDGVNTTQRLSISSLNRVRSFGRMGDTFDEALDKVLSKNEELEEKIAKLEENEVSRLG